MGNSDTVDGRPDKADESGETKLRGEALAGSERKRAADHTQYDESRNPDTVLRVDNEEDTLYDDGLELEDDAPTLVTTPGNDSVR